MDETLEDVEVAPGPNTVASPPRFQVATKPTFGIVW
jgi:hypothetical protein